MGGQESKIDHQKDGIKTKVSPILSRKLEAMKRRSSGPSLSKKMLLKDGSEDDSSGSAKVGPVEPTVSDNGIDKETSAMEKLTLGGKKDRHVSLVCPGSPSFRLYLTETEKQEGKEELTVKESLSDTNHVDVAKEIVESQTSTKEQGSKMKRGSKGMRFRRMIPNGKPVKNFLKVRSCCYCATQTPVA